MNKILSRFALPVLVFAFTSTAQAAPIVVNFDDQPNYPTYFNTGYFKYEQYQMNIVDAADTRWAGTGYADLASLTSSQYVIGNWFGNPTVSFAASSGETFDLTGFAAAGAWGSQTLTIVGFLNGVETQQQQIGITTTADSYTFSGFTGIDRFEVRVGSEFIAQGNGWALNGIAVTPVPEPETYMMLLAGLGIVAAVARRRQMLS